MMRLLVAIAAVTVLGGLSTPPARADFMDGKVLASLCTSDLDWEAGGCVGFIVGVADAFDHRHLSSTGGANGGKYCIPDSATRE